MTPETHPRWRDPAGAAVVFFAGLCLSVVAPKGRILWTPHPPEPVFWVSVVAIGIACAGLGLRRTHPLLDAACCAAAIGFSAVVGSYVDVVLGLIVADVLFCLVRYGSDRVSRTAIIGSIVLGCALVLLILMSVGVSDGLMVLITGPLGLLAPVWWAKDVRTHWLHSLRESERAATAWHSAVTGERARMARELHDSVAGQLSVIALQSEAALNIDLAGADPAVLHRILTAIRENSVSSLGDMRAMIGLLRSGDEPTEQPAALDRLLDDARAAGLRVELADERPAGSEPARAIRLATSRILQEALRNAAKHAPGSSVRIALREQEGGLVIEVTNDIVAGAPPGGGTGTGLLSLRERAHAAGGSIEAGRHDGRWRLRAVLPRMVTA